MTDSAFHPRDYYDSIRRLCAGYVIPGNGKGKPARDVPPLDLNLAIAVRRAAAIYLRLRAAGGTLTPPSGGYEFWVARAGGQILAAAATPGDLLGDLSQVLPADGAA